MAQSQVFRNSIALVPTVIRSWITAHPGQTAFHIANGFLIFTQAALTSRLLLTIGFGPLGPVAGE